MISFERARRRLGAAWPIAGIVVSTACSTGDPIGPAPTLTALPRELSAAERSVRNASNAFAFTLFDKVNAASPGKNVFVSPLSVSMSLGMALNGAGGETRDQMRRVLGFGESEMVTIQSGYRDLTTLLMGLDASTSFQIANSIWYDQAYPFLPAFLESGRTWFDAEIRGVNFSDAGTRNAVNGWVNEKTNGRIPTIVDEVHPDDVMYLINAIWFKGSWRSRFDPSETRTASFTAADGTVQSVPMMSQEVDSAAGFRHFADATVEVGELPYGNGAFAMTILMPRSGTIDSFAATLTQARWDAVVGGLTDRRGFTVALPKFTFTFERELKDDLIALGMSDAFSPALADLSGMTAHRDLYIAFVKHKTFVKVDEVGTEAAAVTNTGIRVTSMPPSFRVDRPFIFAIRERLSGTVLFVGKMAKIP